MGCSGSKSRLSPLEPEMAREPDSELDFGQSDSYIEITDEEKISGSNLLKKETIQNISPYEITSGSVTDSQ